MSKKTAAAVSHREREIADRNQLRRAAGRATQMIEHGPLSFDPSSCEAHLAGQPVDLSRREQALLYANLKSQFKPQWYWSGQAHETESSWAWCQDFFDGSQDYDRKVNEFRARGVRRLPI